MVNIFQPTTGADSGYRDPAKSLTIKALEDRLKNLQGQVAASSQIKTPLANPYQGVAYLGNILASQADEARATSADINARDELAKIKAGIDWTKGPSNEEYSRMSYLDPEGADRIMQDYINHRQEMEKQAKQQEFSTSERQAGETFQHGEHGYEAGLREEAAVSEDKRTAEQKLADEQTGIKKLADETAARKEQWLQLNPGGDINSKEAQAYILTGQQAQRDPLATAAAFKDASEIKMNISHYDSALDNIGLAKELAPNTISGAGNIAAIKAAQSASGFGGDTALKLLMAKNGWTQEQVDATMRFDRIMGMEATTYMSSTLKGQTSNYEMSHFTSIMNNPNSTPQQKLDALTRMESAVQRDRQIANDNLVQFGQSAQPDYRYDRSRVVAPGSDAPVGGGTGGGTPGRKKARDMTDEELKAAAGMGGQ